jgi:hypothetical protein
MLRIDDATTALVAALDRTPSGVYDVVDDEPVRQRQLKTALAVAVGRRRLLSLPAWLVRFIAGPTGQALTRSLRISNRGFREATSWAPAAGAGIASMSLAGAANPASRSNRVPAAVRIGLWLLVLFSLLGRNQ